MSYIKLCLLALWAGVSTMTAQNFLANGFQPVAGVDTSKLNGDGGPAYYSTLTYPAGVAYDAAGNLYIAEQAHIRKIDTSGVITTIAGNGSTESKGDGGPAVAAAVFYASNVTVDSKGNVYFVEDNIHIRRIATDGTISTFAGMFANGYNGEGVPAASAQISAAGLAIDALDQVYFSDPQNGRIRVVRQDGKVYTVAGTGIRGTAGENGPATKAQVLSPAGLAFDAAGNLYIADGRRVLRVDTNGVVTRVAGDPSLPLNKLGVDEVAATATQVNATSVAIDGSGNIVVGTPRIRKITPDGIIHAVAGIETFLTTPFTEACGDALHAVTFAFALTVDRAGNILIANSTAGRLQKVTPDGRISTLAGAGPNRFSGDGGPASMATFASPGGIAFDGAGNLYVADTNNNRVRRIDRNGMVNTVVGDGGPTYDIDAACVADQDSFLSHPQGLAFDAAGNLYVADSGKSRIRKIATDGTQSTVASPPMLRTPVGVAVDASGNLYVADNGFSWVFKISPAGPVNASVSIVSTRGASGSMAFDGAGNLFIPAGWDVDRLGADGALSPVAGIGAYYQSFAPGFTGSPLQIGNAKAVALDTAGSIYVADGGQGTIHRISGNCAWSTVAGPGTAPAGLIVDSQGSLYIADSVQGVIWQTTPVAADPNEKPTPGFAPNAIQSAAVVPLIQPYGQPPLPPYAPPIAAGELVKIRGVCMGPMAPVAGHYDAGGNLPVSVGGVQLTANGIPVPLISVSSGEILAVSPYGLQGFPQWSLSYGGVTAVTSIGVQAAMPAFFTQSGFGSGPAVVLNEDGSMNSQSNPAAKGALVAFFVTGLGQTDPPGVDGLMATAPVPQSLLPVQVSIGGMSAQVRDAGPAPGYVGISQVDAFVPAGLAGQGALPVTLSAGSFNGTQVGVTIWIAP